MSPTLSVLALAASLLLGQQVFRSGTELVEVDAVVLDRNGQSVRGLTALDFELYSEGQRQDIVTFAFIEVPARRAGAPFEPGLSSTATQRASAVYLIVIDYLHTPSRTANLVRHRAREFVEQHLGPSDLAAVVHLGLSAGVVEFSSSKPKLLAAIGGVKGSGGNAGANPTPGVVPTGPPGGATGDAPPDSEVFNLAGLERIERSVASERAERAFEMLGAACEYVAGFTGRRKSMLLFSEGIPIAPQELVPTNQSELANGMAEGAGRDVASRQELIDLARRSNMSLYTIDSRGLDTGLAGVPRPGEGVEQQRLRWNFLRTIADGTGGRAILGHNNLAEPFAQIARDNGSHYLLGFRPRTPAGDDFRELRVRVERDDVQVLARRGYGGATGSRRNAGMRATLARAWAGKTVADLLDRPLPGATSGLPLRVAASVIARAGAKAKVLLIVELDGGALAADASQVDVGYRAISADGEVAANRVDTTRLQLSARTRAAIDAHGWRYLSTFDLPPGAYQLRVAGREAQSGSTGSVFLDLDVPDLSRQPIAIDSVLVGSSTSGATPTAAPQQALLKTWPMLPTARRAFPRSETLTAFTRIADAAGQGMTIGITITAGDGRTMLSASRDVEAARLAPDAAPLALGISLAPFEPGEYTMTVSAGPKAAPARAATRSVVFRVIDAAPARDMFADDEIR